MTYAADGLFGNWRGIGLLALTGVLALAAFLVPAMPQPLTYHVFADCRTYWAIPNFFNVGSNLPFLIGAKRFRIMDIVARHADEWNM